jgi:hypothetical protein
MGHAVARSGNGLQRRHTQAVELLEASTTVEDLVAAALAQRRDVIASIVHARVEALIDEIIEAELAGRANGGSDTAAETAHNATSATLRHWSVLPKDPTPP